MMQVGMGAITNAVNIVLDITRDAIPNVIKVVKTGSLLPTGNFGRAGEISGLYAGYNKRNSSYEEESVGKWEQGVEALQKGMNFIGGSGQIAGAFNSTLKKGSLSEINPTEIEEPSLFEGGGMMKDAG